MGTKQLIIGVDGGGTKSHLAVFSEAGECVGAARCGPLNHECFEDSFQGLEAALREFILSALRDAGASVTDVRHALFGIAGVDTKEQHTVISGILTRIGLPSFTLCNDAFLGIAAGCPEGTGICAVNGTGSVMAGVDGSGASLQVGGIGSLSDDRGGSGWYGSQVLKAVYRELYKHAKKTVLTPAMLTLIGSAGEDDYMETLTTAVNSETLNRDGLNRLVFMAADAGDEVALDILKASAEHYAGGIAYLAQKLDFPKSETLTIAFVGSVFVKERVKILPRLVETAFRAILPDRPAVFLNLETVPVAGAVLWAAKIAGISLGMERIKPALEGLLR